MEQSPHSREEVDRVKSAMMGGTMKKPTALRVIRAKCLDCSNNSSKEVELCPVRGCPLWPWRFGKNPSTAARHGKTTERPQNEFL